VTGVQTCALPIYVGADLAVAGDDGRAGVVAGGLDGQDVGHALARLPQRVDRVGDVVQGPAQGRGSAPHDHRILPVVLVVAAAQAGAAEAERGVQVDRPL